MPQLLSDNELSVRVAVLSCETGTDLAAWLEQLDSSRTTETSTSPAPLALLATLYDQW